MDMDLLKKVDDIVNALDRANSIVWIATENVDDKEYSDALYVVYSMIKEERDKIAQIGGIKTLNSKQRAS